MPLNNFFYGIYNIASLNSTGTTPQPYIIKNLTVDDTMDSKAEFYMQGTLLPKILNIGHTKESFTVESPILVSTSSVNSSNALKDGRQLLFDFVNYKYGTTVGQINYAGNAFNSLPMIESITINIGVDESNVNMSLLSDGDPNNSYNIYNIKKGTSGLVTSVGLNNNARVAKNWDFYVNLGGILYFVENAKITLRAASSEKNFLGAYPFVYNQVPADGLNNGVYTPPDTTYSNWQFPFIAQGGITIEASGKASISIDANNDSINFVNPVSPPNSYPITSRAGLLAAANVTLQDTGVFTPGAGSFQVWLANANSAPIQMIPNALTITNAIITKKNASFTPQMMEVYFSLLAYV
jgi:hypothetical protein